MSWYFKPYVSVADRQSQGQKKLAAFRKEGRVLEPVGPAGPQGKIAASFWGKAWCLHLESFSDYENRLPRGRSYLRGGSVLHLGIKSGEIRALVQGSRLYEQVIRIDPLPAAKWEVVKKKCRGKIGSLVELLQGRLSGEIMAVVTDRAGGLFPAPKEIHMECNCPDWASLCKHLAAVLYGVGARLDAAPELLFKLRGVDSAELIDSDPSTLVGQRGKSRRLAPSALESVFGIELDEEPLVAPGKGERRNEKPARKRAGSKAPIQPTAAGLRRLRKRLGLTQLAMARRLGVSAPTIGNWEKRSGPLHLSPSGLLAFQTLDASSPQEDRRRGVAAVFKSSKGEERP